MTDKNLISYRRDSDIPREFGDFQTELKMARFKRKQEEWSERMSPDEHLKDIMDQKSPLGEPFVTWLVSNCDHTGGADMRFAFFSPFSVHFNINPIGDPAVGESATWGSATLGNLTSRISWAQLFLIHFYLMSATNEYFF